MRIPERKDDLLTLDIRFIPDAHDVEFFLESFGNADDCAVRKRSSQAVKSFVAVISALGDKRSVVRLERYAARNRSVQSALWSFNLDLRIADRNCDAARDRYRFFSYS